MNLLCLECGTELVLSEDHELNRCPNCRGKGVPADLNQTVTLTITRHELRILTIWAGQWADWGVRQGWKDAEIGPKIIRTITDRLATYTDAALSMSQEFADLRAAFPASEVKVYRDDGEQID